MGTESVIMLFGAFFCELVDSSLGMLYGTLLSPALLLAGFTPQVVVPAILFSQAISGLTAAGFHHYFRNADFSVTKFSEDIKISGIISSLGIIATVAAALIAVRVPKFYLEIYIGALVAMTGVVLIVRPQFRFSWKKIACISLLSAFNKSLSGGGYGPIVTAGQVISGRRVRNAVGVTTFAEAPICIAGFCAYFFTKGIADWHLVALLTLGSVLAAPWGAFVASRFRNEKRLKIVLGFLTLALGVSVIFFRLKA